MSKSPTILFVEDDEIFRYAACHYLQAKGYSVVDVPSSLNALRVIDKGGIDVLIADVALYPKEPHGVALARMIRSKHPNIRILFVTGVKDIEQLESAIPGEVLYKPVDLADLSRKVQQLLGASDQPDYSSEAKRFRDKAAEAEQLAQITETESRREALIHVANNYIRTAEQLEGISKADQSRKPKDRSRL